MGMAHGNCDQKRGKVWNKDMLAIFLIFLLGAFMQSLSGFGSALVAMALLPPLLGLTVTGPFVTREPCASKH